ncbi:cilia- and flagella-associated protein 46-like isoform X5 [Lytechinus variegatus]|uniref:cilia- and flagella-associated protein 46-like isoform X5 n=1 Tax=Lytechinus variegatus TaxID=7654 RepID=UPI001BB11189|nr:cilia- and flagella-associated protein 46-like isoform X5 [Lytechinus variegatus]
MDSNIRQLLAATQQFGVQGKGSFLHQAYDLLKSAAESKPNPDGPLPFNQDLYVLCAELALKNDLPHITKECLKMFFMKTPPSNQFLCRAYLCHAQLLAPSSANDPAQLEKAVVYIQKAINFAKENPRYHFLVYNASVLYWQFCRPFLKLNYRQYLSVSLHHVVKALDDIEDKDYEWRAQLMIALIECHVDAGRTKEAAEVSKATAEFTKTHVPLLYKQVIALQVRHQLVDMGKLQKDLRSSGELTVYFKLMKLRVAFEQGEITDYSPHLERILKNIVHDEDFSRASSSMSVASGRKTATPTIGDDRNRSSGAPTQGSGEGGREQGSSSSSIASIIRLANTASEVSSSADELDSSCSSPTDDLLSSGSSKLDPPVASLLLDLARLCSEYNLPDLLARTLDAMKNFPLKDKGAFFEMEFLQCELMVRNLLDKQEAYNKNAVEVRLHAIDRLSEAVMNAVRHGDPNIIQAGCVTLWNMCLPLLQLNLRGQLRKPLTLLAESLENIQSLLILLRCQVHTELAKCEEDMEQIQVAMEHLKKALGLDDGGLYHERLETSLHRLELRAELYKPPERLEDQAAMIIEQARTSADSGTVLMKRSLLVKAGQALSPDAFMLVLESERAPKAGGRGADSIIAQLGAKARNFKKSTKKANGHIKRLGSENERERARLWGDLAKTARKQEVWDICRVAARFCLLYDDDRWSKPQSPTRPDTRQENASVASDHPPTSETPTNRTKKSQSTVSSEPVLGLSDKDLIRMLAEVHFLNSEALIHLLRSEGVEMYNKPIPPVDKRKHPKGYIPKKPEEDPDWIDYCEFINDLTASSTKGFLRAAELGVTLNESWIVCSAASYFWNYTNHVMTENRHRELVPSFTSLLQAMKQVGHSSETVLLVNLCNALAVGLILPWIPHPDSAEPDQPTPHQGKGKGGKDPDPSPRKAKSVASHTSGKSKMVLAVDPDGSNDIKQALEVCDYAIAVTNGTRPLDLVPIAIRHPLLITWVRVKQLISQQIQKSLGTEDENNMEGQRPLTRCLVALEMLTLNGNGIMDFKEAPSLNDLSNLVEQCQWPDPSVELQVWSRLAYLAYKSRNHSLVMRCAAKAMAFDGIPIKHRRLDEHKQMVWYEMLSYASCVLGQSHVRSMDGNNAVRRSAMEAFLYSARYGRKANNYDLVITAARRYWNSCLVLISEPLERQLLKEPLTSILECINATYKKDVKVKTDDSDDEGDDGGAPTPRTVTSMTTLPPSTVDILSDPEDDVTLRAAIYGVLFQAYADQGEWEAALAAMDKAVNDMPRTRHRLLIFKHRLMVKAQLGRDIHVDIAKFRDESEDYVALMWYKVAKCSKDQFEQLTAYQNAIEALRSPSSDWQKVEYLMEFAEWLYLNEFPLQDCMDQLEWAADILLNMKIRTRSAKKSAGSERGKKKKSKRSSKVNTPVIAEIQQPSPAPTDNKTVDTMESGDADGNESSRYIPVQKTSVIGLSASNLDLSVEEITSAKILEHLIRIHTMLAVVAGRGTDAHSNYCILAWGFLSRLMQVSITSAGQVAKELAKAAAANEQAATKGSAKGKKGGDKGKGAKEQEPVKEKPKRKGPIDAVPTSPEEWAGYDVPDEIREAFKHDPSGESINKASILKPTLTMYYLETLVRELRAANFSHLVFPALNMAEVIARDIVISETSAKTYRLIAAEVCWEMNLPMAAKYHEAVVGPTNLSTEEQAKSRDEIAKLREKQAQVQREAKRVEELKRTMSGDKTKAPQLSRSIIAPDQKTDIVEAVKGFKKALSAQSYRQAWTQQAEILIKQGYYQSARELLNEAYLAAQAFEDTWTQAYILLHLASLAIADEANYGQAINLLKEAQTLESDEMFWLKTTLLMVDAYLGDIEDRERSNKARSLILKSLATFTALAEKRPNKAGMITYIKATLDAKFGEIQVNQVLQECRDTMQPKAHRELQTACQRFDHSAKEMLGVGYKREAIQILQQQANVLRLFACDSQDKELQHKFLLEAYSVMKTVVSIADDLMIQIQTLSSVTEMRNVSLPVQREACAAKLTLSELLIDVFAIFAEEDRKHRIAESRKGSLEKLVEEFIAATPVMSDVTRDWKELTSTVSSSALNQLTGALTLGGVIPHLKAKAMYNIGRCLRMLGIQRGPNPPNQWDVQFMNLVPVAAAASKAPPQPTQGDGDGEEEAEAMVEEQEEELSPAEIRQAEKITKMVNQYKGEQTASELYLSQATEVLAQCVQLSLQNNLKDMVRSACMDIIEACGQYDQAMASHYLALYQSCQASASLEDTLSRAQVDPTTSRQANILHQRQQLLGENTTTNQAMGTVMKTAVDALGSESEAWKRLLIANNHLELMKELPPNFNIVILQHTDDRSVLYGGILDKPKAGGKEGGRSKGGSTHTSRAKVTRNLVEPSALENLCYRFRQHKQEVMQTLLKAEYRRSQKAQRQRMLENLSDDMKEAVTELADDLGETENHLQAQFINLLSALEDYLRPITSYLEPAIRALDTSNNPPVGRDAANQTQDECVIILADQWLLEMPLEALAIFSSPAITALTRDFSLQMLYNRFYREPEDEMSDDKKKKEAAKAKAAKDKNKGVKMVPLDRTVPPGCLPLDTHSFKYVVDPHYDSPETDVNSPVHVTKEALQLYQTQFTARWEGLLGDDHIPSLGEFEEQMKDCNAFIFYGLEKFLSQLPPFKLAPVNLSEISLAIILDLVQTNQSFMRQSKIDVEKSNTDLSLEKPVETAMLLSLAGAGCVMSNQWHCKLGDNASTFNTLMKGLLETGRTTGQTVRRMFIPYYKAPGEEEEEGEGEGEDAPPAEKDGKTSATAKGKAKASAKGGKGGKQEEPKKEKEKGRKKSGSMSGRPQGRGSATPDVKGQEGKGDGDQLQLELLNRGWFNFVCYGLPNLMVTQV